MQNILNTLKSFSVRFHSVVAQPPCGSVQSSECEIRPIYDQLQKCEGMSKESLGRMSEENGSARPLPARKRGKLTNSNAFASLLLTASFRQRKTIGSIDHLPNHFRISSWCERSNASIHERGGKLPVGPGWQRLARLDGDVFRLSPSHGIR